MPFCGVFLTWPCLGGSKRVKIVRWLCVMGVIVLLLHLLLCMEIFLAAGFHFHISLICVNAPLSSRQGVSLLNTSTEI